MKRNSKIIALVSALLIVILTISAYLSNLIIEKSLIGYWTIDNPNYTFDAHDVLRCDYHPFFPEIAFISESQFKNYEHELNVHFYSVKKPFSKEKNNREYTGGTTIKNTTFPELVKMVKDDCSQFQYGYDNPDPEGPRWTYTAYVEKPASKPMTDTEIRAEQVLGDFSKLPEEQQLKIRQNYGEYLGLTPQEVVDWEAQITRDINDGKFSLD